MGNATQRQNWTFLTNHARVLVTIARDPAVRLRDVAAVCGLTERTVQTIVTDLEADGYLRRVRDGRRNRYDISAGAVFRHPAEAGVRVAGLLALLTGATPEAEAPAPEPEPSQAVPSRSEPSALDTSTPDPSLLDALLPRTAAPAAPVQQAPAAVRNPLGTRRPRASDNTRSGRPG